MLKTIEHPKRLKKDDIVVYVRKGLSKLTLDKKYKVEGTYGDHYGIQIINDKGELALICNDNVRDYFRILVSDNVDHPSWYNSNPSGIECIDVARHYCFSIGNAMKYLWRAGLKKDASLDDRQKEIEDLKKAIFYINDRIRQLENDNSK